MDKLPLLYGVARIGAIIGAIITGRWLWQDYRADLPRDRMTWLAFIGALVIFLITLTPAV